MSLGKRVKDLGRNVLSPLAEFLAVKNVSPDLLTFLGLLITVSSIFFYSHGEFFKGAIFIIFGGLFDSLDGEVARREKRVTKRGAYLDSNLDRISDFAPLFGIAIYYIKYNQLLASLTFVFMFGALMVSYTRARAEGLNIECKVGLADRTFRILFLIIGSMFGPEIFGWFLIFLIITTYTTLITRIVYSMRRL